MEYTTSTAEMAGQSLSFGIPDELNNARMESAEANNGQASQETTARKNKKLSIIVFSGDFDRLTAAFTLATGAASEGYDVNLFFTFWGLNAIKKRKGRRFTGKGFLGKCIGFLTGGLNNAPTSRLNMGGLSPILFRHLMKKNNVATLEELVEAAKALGVNLYACEMAMHVLGLNRTDFIDEVKDVLGVSSFLELSENGRTLFI